MPSRSDNVRRPVEARWIYAFSDYNSDPYVLQHIRLDQL